MDGFRLILLDLDGTLLNTERAIHAENLRVLQGLMARGLRVGFSTGRAPRSAQRYVDMLQPNAPSIHFNGAVVRDARTDMRIWSHALGRGVAGRALDAARAHIRHANIYVDDEIWGEQVSPTSLASETKDGVPHTLVPDARARIEAGAVVTKVMLIADAERIPALTHDVAAAVGEDAALVNSESEYLEVLPPGCSKRTGAEALVDHLGFTLANVIAFGDNLNDLELLTACGLGVAMAGSHAEVLARVPTHVGSHDTDAIARFLESLRLEGDALFRR